MEKVRRYNHKSLFTRKIEGVGLVFSSVGTFFILAWVLWYSRYGIDFTDESFYLVRIANPFHYNFSSTQFGFIYHPLHELLNGNIVALRWLNILSIFGLAWIMFNIFLSVTFFSLVHDDKKSLIISAALATSSLVYLQTWLPTPSYNSLNLQALMVTASGLLLADKKCSLKSTTGWILIGIGGWLAFMAKPPTAVALALCSIAYLLIAGKNNFRLLFISIIIAFALLVLSALLIDGSILEFISRIKGGIELGKIRHGVFSIFHIIRLDEFQFSHRMKTILTISTVIFFLAACLSQSNVKSIAYGGATLMTTFIVVTLLITLGLTSKTINVGRFQGLLIWAVPLSSILTGLVLSRIKNFILIPRTHLACILIFSFFPLIYSVGTDSNYWFKGSSVGIFWIMAGLVFLNSLIRSTGLIVILLSLGLATQATTAVLIQTGIELPYRQSHSLRQNNYKTSLGKSGTTLILSESFGEYFDEAITSARQAQFKSDTPIIDLTGQSPGILYALGAKNVGLAWTLGGYPGSDRCVTKVLNRVSCKELSSAWLLVESEGARSISSEVLTSFGANLTKDYQLVASWETAKGAGGYRKSRLQQLLKPIHSTDVSISRCENFRGTGK